MQSLVIGMAAEQFEQVADFPELAEEDLALDICEVAGVKRKGGQFS